MNRFLFLVASVLLLPTLALAAPKNFQELVERLIVVLDLMVPILISAALVVYFYNIAGNILNFSGDASAKLKSFYGYGILILFVMVSIWGILRLMVATFFAADNAAPSFIGGSTETDGECEFGEC
jgi:uncharacterized membrane protein